MTRHRTRHRGIYYRNGSDDPNAAGPRRYIVWFQDSEGKGRTETLPPGSTEKDALARQAELRGKASRGERVVVSKVTLQAFAEEWLEGEKTHLSEQTVRTYAQHLRVWIYPRLGRRKLQDVSIDDVARLVREMKAAGKSAWTIKGVLSPLSRVYARAVRQGLVNSNPVKGLEKSERPKVKKTKLRILTSKEIELVLKHCPERWRTLLATLIFTGMRISEALELRWEQVDFAAGTITVGESKTDAGTFREIVLMPSLGKVLREHKLASSFSGDADLVFPTGRGTVQDRGNVWKWSLKVALENAGLDHLTFHKLRHTYASILIGQGFDVTFVANQLGHSDPAITLRIYAHLFDPVARRDEARTRLEAAFGAVV